MIFDVPAVGEKEIKYSNFREYYSLINPAFHWDNLLPFIKDAVKTYIYPHVGRTFYNSVCDHVPDLGFRDEIKELMASCIAKYTIYLAMPHINVTLSDKGVQQNRSDNSSPAPQWATNHAKWAILYAAEKSLDDLLNFMYDNKNETFLTSWTDTEFYKFIFTDFISGRKEIANLSSVKTMRIYWYVVPYIREKEEALKKILGYRTYDDIKSKLLTGNEKEQNLIKLIKMYIINGAVYESLPGMNVVLEDGNLFSVNLFDVPNLGVNAAANITAVNTYREQTKNKCKHYENEIRNYLSVYLDDFPMWKEDCHIEDRPRSVFHSPDCVGGIMI